MANPFKKVVADFGGGVNDYLAPEDIAENQFTTLENLDNTVPGKITKSLRTGAVTPVTQALSTTIADTGTAFYPYKVNYNIGSSSGGNIASFGPPFDTGTELLSSMTHVRVTIVTTTTSSVTGLSDHGLTTGDTVEIYGGSAGYYTGTYRVTVDSKTSFLIETALLTDVSGVTLTEVAFFKNVPAQETAQWYTAVGKIGTKNRLLNTASDGSSEANSDVLAFQGKHLLSRTQLSGPDAPGVIFTSAAAAGTGGSPTSDGWGSVSAVNTGGAAWLVLDTEINGTNTFGHQNVDTTNLIVHPGDVVTFSGFANSSNNVSKTVTNVYARHIVMQPEWAADEGDASTGTEAAITMSINYTNWDGQVLPWGNTSKPQMYGGQSGGSSVDDIDDFEVSGSYYGTTDLNYLVQPDANGTFKWSDDDGATFDATGVSYVANTWYHLNNGIYIRWTKYNNHPITSFWRFTAYAGESKPSLYSQSGILRLSDGRFNIEENKNRSQWYGCIDRKRFGEGVDYGITPRFVKPDLSNRYYKYTLMDQYIAPPTIVKMDGIWDPTGKVKNSGETGLFIFDPLKYNSIAENRSEHIYWEDAQESIGKTFHLEDRWATSFVYDYTNESELSRNSIDNSIGVSGFDVIDIGDQKEDLLIFKNSSGDEKTVTVDDSVSASRSDTAIEMTAIDADYGAHKVLQVGDMLKIGSEILCVTHIDGTVGSSKTTINVHRGCSGTSPSDLQGYEVYKYPIKQKARAVNLVLNAANNTAASVTADGVTFTANKSLGHHGNYLHVVFDVYAISSGNSRLVIQKYNQTVSGIAVDDTVNVGRVVVQIDFYRNSSYSLTKGDIVYVINNGTLPPGTSNVDVDIVSPIQDMITASVTAAEENTDVDASVDIDGGQLAGGLTECNLNPRITSTRLYWQPKDEVDWFLVEEYDIDKGAAFDSDLLSGANLKAKRLNIPSDIVVSKPETESNKAWRVRKPGQQGHGIGSDFGAWIRCPFWVPSTFDLGIIPDAKDMFFTAASNWDNGAGSNAMDSYNESTSNMLYISPTSDGSNMKWASLDHSKFDANGLMVNGQKYILEYSFMISSYTSGTLSVGLANDSYSLQHVDTYTATSSSSVHFLEWTYSSSDDTKIIIHAATSTALTASFDYFKIRENTREFGINDISAYRHTSFLSGNSGADQTNYGQGTISMPADPGAHLDKDHIILAAPISNSFSTSNVSGDLRFHKNIGKFNQLRTCYFDAKDITAHRSDNDGHMSIGDIKLGDEAAINANNQAQVSFTQNESSSTITGYKIEIWNNNSAVDLGALGWRGGDLIIIAKSLAEGADPFPNDMFGIYKIKNIPAGSNDIYVDESYKQIPRDIVSRTNDGAALKIDCVIRNGKSLTNHVGYNWDFTPFKDQSESTDYGLESKDQDGYDDEYTLKTSFARTDVVTTFYLPFNGNRMTTYQSLTGREANHKIQPVRWKANTMIGNSAVIGNIDIEDGEEQRVREQSRIMWTRPFALDEFTLFRSRDIGASDTGEIKSLEFFGNSLFVIKDTNTYILDPNQNFREVGLVPNIGVDSGEASCVSSIGVICASSKQVSVLPSQQELSLPIRATWQAETFNNTKVGFSAKQNEIIVIPDSSTSGTTMWIYNINFKGWRKETYSSGTQISNIVLSDDMEATMIEYDSNDQAKVVKYKNGTSGNNTSKLKSKTFYFGDPNISKYISEIMVTYKSDSDLTIRSYIDGVDFGSKRLPRTSKQTNRRVRVNKEGQRYAFEIEVPSASVNESLEISDIVVSGWYNDKD